MPSILDQSNKLCCVFMILQSISLASGIKDSTVNNYLNTKQIDREKDRQTNK